MQVMNVKTNVLLMCGVIGLGTVAYIQMSSKPKLYQPSEATCKEDAIKQITNITERAILASKCAERNK